MTMHDVARKYGPKFAPKDHIFCDDDYISSENEWFKKKFENNDPSATWGNLLVFRNMGYSFLFDTDDFGNEFPLAFGITSIVEPHAHIIRSLL